VEPILALSARVRIACTDGMRVFAFHGLRYNPRMGQPGPLAAPPFDQIDPELRDRLHAEPRHFSHLTRPVAERNLGPHQAAADLHSRWLAEGVVGEEAEAALYPCEIRLPEGGRRLGLTALVGLEEPSSGTIQPHEATVPKTVDERLSLLRTMEADLEPILLLGDAPDLDGLLAEDIEAQQPLVEHQDLFGNRHLLYRVVDRLRIARYREALQDAPGLIADGHHRYTVAWRYAAEKRPQPHSPAACKLAVITSLSSSGLRIDPIHRGLLSIGDLRQGAHLLRSRRSIEALSGESLVAAVAAAPQPSMAIWQGKGRAEVMSFDPVAAPPEIPATAHHLAVSWLHSALLPALGLPPEAARDGTVLYRSDPESLFAAVRQGELAAGFWLPGMSPEAFAKAIAEGDLLPPKSTRFLPKVVSGLVWVRHSSQLA
jgi:uncharacterized protein (DUF1015 family)